MEYDIEGLGSGGGKYGRTEVREGQFERLCIVAGDMLRFLLDLQLPAYGLQNEDRKVARVGMKKDILYVNRSVCSEYGGGA